MGITEQDSKPIFHAHPHGLKMVIYTGHTPLLFNDGTVGYGTHPQLVVHARRVLFNEGTIVGGDVLVVGVLLQHVDLGLDFFLFLLSGHMQQKIMGYVAS